MGKGIVITEMTIPLKALWVVQWFSVGLMIERSWVWFPAESPLGFPGTGHIQVSA
jgi:hypothetical protein